MILHQMSDVKPFHLSLPPPLNFSPEQRCGKGKGTLVYKYFAPLELSVSAFSFAFFSCQLPPLA
jgi:hypothetical protein